MKQVQTRSDAFTEFVREAEPRLRHALVAGWGGDRGREATAEALAWAWEHWDRVAEMENPVGYLYRVGHTRGRRLLRRPGRLPRPEHAEMPWIEPALPDALDALSQRQRTAVMLVKGFEWTYQEVAELLGISLSSTQKHVERGLSKLRAALEVSNDV